MKYTFNYRYWSVNRTCDVIDDEGNIAYVFKHNLFGSIIGHEVALYKGDFKEKIGQITQRVLHLFATYDIYLNHKHIGQMKGQMDFSQHKYRIDKLGWEATGRFYDWDFFVKKDGQYLGRITRATNSGIEKYYVDIKDEENTPVILMFVMAISCNQGYGKPEKERSDEEARLISGEKLCVEELKSIRDQLNSMIEKEEWEEKNPITGASVGGGKPTQGIHF